MLVPSPHFNLQDASVHLDLLNGTDVNRALLSEQMIEWGVHNIFRLPSNMPVTVSQLSGSHYFHHHTVTLKTNSFNTQQAAYIDFRTDEFSVIILREKRLLLAQVYPYTSPEDVLYHLLKIFEQLDLSQREASLFLSGFIDENSALMRELNKYFLHATFEELSPGITISDSFQGYPSHFFNSISKLAACVSSEVN